MTTHSKYTPPVVGRIVFYDGVTFEEVGPMSPVHFYEDFLGAGNQTIPVHGSPIAGYPWVVRTVGTAPTAAGLADASCGVIGLALTSTSEKQEATLYQNDQQNFDVTKGLVFECGISLPVLPSAAGVQFVAGLSSAWIDGPNNASEYLEFGATANGAVSIRSQDGVTQSSVASGVSFLANALHILRIDATALPAVTFFIDGNGVGSLNFAATGSSAILQPYFSCYKPSGAGVATLNVDFCRVASRR
jgi:hypothetical protein